MSEIWLNYAEEKVKSSLKEEKLVTSENEEMNTVYDAEVLKKQVAEFRKDVEDKKDAVNNLNQKIFSLLTREEEAVEGGAQITAPISLGERLIKKGVISQDQLEIALKEQ